MFYAFIIYHNVFCIYVFVYVYVYMFYGGLAIVGKSTFLLKYYINRSLFCFGVGRCVEIWLQCAFLMLVILLIFG